MILEGSTISSSGHAKQMALHLFKDENEQIHVHGLGRADLTAVQNRLVDMYRLTDLTKGKKNAIFHVAISPREHESLNPEQKDRALQMIEERFALQDQVRFSIDHVKEGRAHSHVFWSAVDIENEKLINLSYYKRTLQTLGREMELEFGHELTPRRASENSHEVTLADRFIQARTGEKALDRKLLVTALWNQTINAKDFISDLKNAGYDVVKGDGCKFGIMDRKGHVHNLVRDLPKPVKVKHVMERFGPEYDKLPSVEQARERRSRQQEPAPEKQIQDPKLTKALNHGLDHFLERHSAVSVEDLSKYINADHSFAPSEIHAALKQHENIIMAAKDDETYVTTFDAVEAEEKMIACVKKGRRTGQALNGDYVPKQSFLNEGQRNAIAHALTSKDQVIVISGGAGVGKTSLMKEVKQGIEENSKRLFAFAPSANASRGVLREKGFEGANTISNLLRKRTLQEQTRNGVILIDEAGMVGIKTMNRIFEVAEKMNARVILSGDWHQHNSPEAGDALRIIEQKAGLEIGRVTKIVRQKNESYKQAVDALAKGEVQQGFSGLQKMGAFQVIMDDDRRYEQVASDYLRSIKQDRTTLVVSPTHAEGRAVSAVIREKLKSEGLIGKKDKTFDTQRNKSLTMAQRKRAKYYKPGMSIQFHGKVDGFEMGQAYDVTGHNDDGQVIVQNKSGKQQVLPLYEATKFQTFIRSKTSFTKGDLLKITANGQTLSGQPLNNGDVFTVAGFDKQGNIKLENGEVIAKEYRNITLGYYNTSHASQGKDAQDVFVVQGARSFLASNDKQFYVSVSRGEDTIKIYTDDLEGLKRRVAKSGDRMTAMDIAQNCPTFVFNRKVNAKQGENRTPEVRLEFQERIKSGSGKKGEIQSGGNVPLIQDQSHLEKLDRMMAWSKIEKRKRAELQKHLSDFYERSQTIKDRQKLKIQLEKHDTRLGRLTGKYKKLKEQHRVLTLNLENIDMRISETWEGFEAKIERERKAYFKRFEKQPSEQSKPTSSKTKDMDRYKAKIRERMQESFKRSKDKGFDFELRL